MVTLAKGLASGFPLSALLFRAELSSWPPGAHGTTFGGNPVAAAAAHATLDLLEEGLMANAREQGAYLKARLEELLAGAPGVVEVRGRGLLLAVAFESGERRDRAVRAAFEEGLLTLPAGPDALRIAPPLILTREEAEEGARRLAQAVRRVS